MSNTAIAVVRSESYLIGCAVSGDKSAFAKLFKAHYLPCVEKAAEELCDGKIDKARDLIQQAFTEIYHNILSIDRNQPFAESVMDCARDCALSADYKNTANLVDFLSLSEESTDSEFSPDGDPADAMAHRQSIVALEAITAMNKASGGKYADGIRYLFAMCEKGLSAAEIAEQENKTPTQVQKAMKRACDALRPVLAPYVS